MPRLDAFIDVLFQKGADALVLETGSVALLEGPGPALVPLIKRALTTAHIVSAVSELVPTYAATAFTGKQDEEIAYDVHSHKRYLVHQREVGAHTATFKTALRAALREDPDIVLIGEMRDLETISIALETAETGHLVFGTLHTNTAPSTVDRIIDQFPADRQAQVRTMLYALAKAVAKAELRKSLEAAGITVGDAGG